MPPDRCNQCGFRFGREPGYYFGVLTPILPILSLGTGALCAASAFLFFAEEIPVVLTAGAMGAAFGFLFFWRTAIAIYMALDHAIDPPSGSDTK